MATAPNIAPTPEVAPTPEAAPAVTPGTEAFRGGDEAGNELAEMFSGVWETPATGTPAPTAEELAVPAAEAAAPASAAEPAPAPAPVTPPAASAVPAAPTDPEAALRANSNEAMIAALQAEVAALRAAQPAASGTPAPAAPGPSGAEEAPPEYRFAIDDTVMSALQSEDPAQFRMGVTHLINQIGLATHLKVRAEMKQTLDSRLSQMAGAIQEPQIKQQQQAMQDAYFGKFPTHKEPAFRAILNQEATRMAAEFPNASWDENYQLALGTRVNAAVAALTGGAAAPAPTPAATPRAPAARPAPALPTSAPAAGGAIPAFEAQADEIADTFAWR